MKNFKILVVLVAALMFCNCSDDDDDSCCRVCSTGQACGDSCIAETATCNEAPGCACNGGSGPLY